MKWKYILGDKRGGSFLGGDNRQWSINQKDLKQVRDIFREELDIRVVKSENTLDKKVDTKFAAYDKTVDGSIADKLDCRIGELEQKMFEWKSEIIDVVDGLVKKIRDGREFREISGHQTADNTRRIEKLERKVFGVAEV